MNTETTTTSPLANVDPALYTVLKKKQQEFIHILDRDADADMVINRAADRQFRGNTVRLQQDDQ